MRDHRPLLTKAFLIPDLGHGDDGDGGGGGVDGGKSSSSGGGGGGCGGVATGIVRRTSRRATVLSKPFDFTLLAVRPDLVVPALRPDFADLADFALLSINQSGAMMSLGSSVRGVNVADKIILIDCTDLFEPPDTWLASSAITHEGSTSNFDSRRITDNRGSSRRRRRSISKENS